MSGHNIKKVAERSGISEKTVMRALKDGRLGYLTVGSRIVIRDSDIENYEKMFAKEPGRAKALAREILQDE